jgi:dCTP deaminase
MPLTDKQIIHWARNGGVTPFDPTMVNPASIDLRIDRYWLDFHGGENMFESENITLYPSSLYVQLYNLLSPIKKLPIVLMGMSYETISIPDDMAASLKLKTTPSRKGLGQVIGDWVDPGYYGKLTLMFQSHGLYKFTYKQRIVQLVMHRLDDAVTTSYAHKGHYQNQDKPTRAWDEKRL